MHTWNFKEMNIPPHSKGKEVWKTIKFKISIHSSYFYNFVYSIEQSEIPGAP